jgi:dephospho-CoA kinase
MHSLSVPTDPQRSDAGVTGACTPPIGRYLPVPVEIHQADPDAPEVARRLIALIATRWPATPAEHVGSSAVPGLVGKNIIDLLLAAEPPQIPAITQALLELGFQPQIPAAFPATRPMLGRLPPRIYHLPGPRARGPGRQPGGRRHARLSGWLACRPVPAPPLRRP